MTDLKETPDGPTCESCGRVRPKGRDVTCPHCFALQGSECRECASVLYRIGSHFACRDNACSRYALMVDDRGYTEDKAQNQAERDFERMSGANDGGGYYSSERMDAARRIGQ